MVTILQPCCPEAAHQLFRHSAAADASSAVAAAAAAAAAADEGIEGVAAAAEDAGAEDEAIPDSGDESCSVATTVWG
jgi:hypothetical protein